MSRERVRTRRRWVTLAEVLAIAGVVIAGLTLWNAWSERRSDEAARIAERADANRAKTRIDLSASIADGGRTLMLRDANHEIRDATFVFPKALDITAQTPVAAPAIAVDWIEPAILKLTDGGADDRAGRLPVLVTIRYVDGDATRTVSGIYDAIWKTEGRMLRGRTVRFDGFRLHERGGSQARLDAIWAQEKP